MKLNPSNEDHRAILERFLSDQPEHRQFIDPARQSLLRVAPDEYLPISDVLDTLQILAIDHAHDLAAHEAAVKAHKANALSDQDHMNLDRDITDLQNKQAGPAERYSFTDDDVAKLTKLQGKRAAGRKRSPNAPELTCTEEMVPYVYLAMRHSNTDDLVAALTKKHGIEKCMAADCHDPVMLTRQGTPRFGTRHWESITPWAGCGFCDAHHADEFSDGRVTAFRAFAVWQSKALVQLANENVLLKRATHELAASVERLVDHFETAPVKSTQLEETV
jgi:hypothetical protein